MATSGQHYSHAPNGDVVTDIQRAWRGYLGRKEFARVELLQEREKLKSRKNRKNVGSSSVANSKAKLALTSAPAIKYTNDDGEEVQVYRAVKRSVGKQQVVAQVTGPETITAETGQQHISHFTSGGAIDNKNKAGKSIGDSRTRDCLSSIFNSSSSSTHSVRQRQYSNFTNTDEYFMRDSLAAAPAFIPSSSVGVGGERSAPGSAYKNYPTIGAPSIENTANMAKYEQDYGEFCQENAKQMGEGGGEGEDSDCDDDSIDGHRVAPPIDAIRKDGVVIQGYQDPYSYDGEDTYNYEEVTEIDELDPTEEKSLFDIIEEKRNELYRSSLEKGSVLAAPTYESSHNKNCNSKNTEYPRNTVGGKSSSSSTTTTTNAIPSAKDLLSAAEDIEPIALSSAYAAGPKAHKRTPPVTEPLDAPPPLSKLEQAKLAYAQNCQNNFPSKQALKSQQYQQQRQDQRYQRPDLLDPEDESQPTPRQQPPDSKYVAQQHQHQQQFYNNDVSQNNGQFGRSNDKNQNQGGNVMIEKVDNVKAAGAKQELLMDLDKYITDVVPLSPQRQQRVIISRAREDMAVTEGLYHEGKAVQEMDPHGLAQEGEKRQEEKERRQEQERQARGPGQGRRGRDNNENGHQPRAGGSYAQEQQQQQQQSDLQQNRTARGPPELPVQQLDRGKVAQQQQQQPPPQRQQRTASPYQQQHLQRGGNIQQQESQQQQQQRQQQQQPLSARGASGVRAPPSPTLPPHRKNPSAPHRVPLPAQQEDNNRPPLGVRSRGGGGGGGRRTHSPNQAGRVGPAKGLAAPQSTPPPPRNDASRASLLEEMQLLEEIEKLNEMQLLKKAKEQQQQQQQKQQADVVEASPVRPLVKNKAKATAAAAGGAIVARAESRIVKRQVKDPTKEKEKVAFTAGARAKPKSSKEYQPVGGGGGGVGVVPNIERAGAASDRKNVGVDAKRLAQWKAGVIDQQQQQGGASVVSPHRPGAKFNNLMSSPRDGVAAVDSAPIILGLPSPAAHKGINGGLQLPRIDGGGGYLQKHAERKEKKQQRSRVVAAPIGGFADHHHQRDVCSEGGARRDGTSRRGGGAAAAAADGRGANNGSNRSTPRSREYGLEETCSLPAIPAGRVGSGGTMQQQQQQQQVVSTAPSRVHNDHTGQYQDYYRPIDHMFSPPKPGDFVQNRACGYKA